jgi:hypothetical protein
MRTLVADASADRRAAVVSKAVVRSAAILGMKNAALARTLGVSDPTVFRFKSGERRLEVGTKPYELSLLLIRLFRSLDAILGGEEEVIRSWMETENRALGGVPHELIQNVSGLVAAVDYVDSARARI